MKKIIIPILVLIVMSIGVTAESMTRGLPTSAGLGQTFTLTYTPDTTGLATNWGVMIGDEITGGCTPNHIATGFMSPQTSSSITITAPSTAGTCTFSATGNYQFADASGIKSTKYFNVQTVTITGTTVCTDDCTTSGSKACITSTAYKTCGNTDTDACLDWSTPTACPTGQSCSGAGVCSATVTCGNGAIDSGEQCDGTNLNSKTCATQGFTGGTLSCSACQFDTTSCTTPPPPPPTNTCTNTTASTDCEAWEVCNKDSKCSINMTWVWIGVAVIGFILIFKMMS